MVSISILAGRRSLARMHVRETLRRRGAARLVGRLASSALQSTLHFTLAGRTAERVTHLGSQLQLATASTGGIVSISRGLLNPAAPGQTLVCYARILDLKRIFLEAALRYYDISQIEQRHQIGQEEIDENALERAFSSAVTCTILAGAGPQRSGVPATLYKHVTARTGAMVSITRGLLNPVAPGQTLQVVVIREKLAELYESGHQWSKEAQMLSGIDLDSGIRMLDDTNKLSKCVQIARLYSEDDDAVNAEAFINKASFLVTNRQHEVLNLLYKVCYARILDLKRNFLEAALRYYDISQIEQRQIREEEIDENALEEALGAAVTCTILAGAGPQRSRVLATLYKSRTDKRVTHLGSGHSSQLQLVTVSTGAILSLARGLLNPAAPRQTLQMRRFCSGLSLPHLPTDVLQAPDPCVVEMHSFRVNVGEVKRLEDAMDREKAVAKERMEESVRKSNFDRLYRTALARRGLLWAQSLQSDDTQNATFRVCNIIGRPPKYMTADRFMVHIEEMPRPYCRKFLDSLSNEKVIILDSWTAEINTTVAISMYDHGVNFPGQDVFCKGESDGSFCDGKAKVGAILWMGSQIYICEIYCDVPCKSSTMAEARGMFLQLELGIPLQYLQPCTDNYSIYRVVKGELHKLEDDQEGMCDLLRHMRVYYKGLAPRWVPREELASVDGLLRDPRLGTGPLNDESNQLVANELIKRCANPLNGEPSFTIQGKQPAVKRPSIRTPILPAESYLKVEEEGKTDALFHIIHALRPVAVSVLCKDVRQLEKDITNRFGDCITSVKSDCQILSFAPSVEAHKRSRNLFVVLDLSVPRDSYMTKDFYTVYVATEEETKLLEFGIPEYGPLAFVAFHQVPQ